MHWDRFTALASLSVAVTALGVSIWQGWVTTKRNRLTVIPQVQISRYLDPKTEDHNGMIVTNGGLGPATVENSLLTLDGNVIGPINRPTWLKIDNESKHLGILDRSIFSSGTFMPVGSRYEIIGLTEENSHKTDEFREFSNRLKLDLCYCSVYDDCWITSWEYEISINSENVSNVSTDRFLHI